MVPEGVRIYEGIMVPEGVRIYEGMMFLGSDSLQRNDVPGVVGIYE